MANFDALRPAVVGPLAYLCKPTAPAELLGCWPLMTGSDKSRYNGYASAPASASVITTKQDGTVLPYKAVKIGSGSAVSYALGKTLDLSQDWTVDYFDCRWTGGPHCASITTVGNITATTFRPGLQTMGIFAGSTQICPMDNDFFTNLPFFHFAMVYRASTKKMVCFINGHTNSNYQGSIDLSGNSSIGIITQQANDADYAFANFRVIQKAVGTTTSFPVPSTLYTGYEAL